MARAMFAPVIGKPGLLQPVDDLEVLLLGDGGLLLGHAGILAGGPCHSGRSRGLHYHGRRGDRRGDSCARDRRLARDRRGDRPRLRRARLHARPGGAAERTARGARRRAARERSAAISGDVSDPDSIAAAVEQFGDVDVLVANAGITHYRPFAQLPLDEARQMNDVNWLGTIHTVQAALPGMLERGRGHIVVVSSGGGRARLPLRRGLQRHQGRAARLRRGAASRAGRQRGLGHDGLPGRDRDLAPRPRAGPHAGLVPDGPPRRPRGRWASRWSRPWRTTGASCSTRRSCACCGW